MWFVATPLGKQFSNALIPFIKIVGFFFEGRGIFFSFKGFFFTFFFSLHCHLDCPQTHNNSPAVSHVLVLQIMPNFVGFFLVMS